MRKASLAAAGLTSKWRGTDEALLDALVLADQWVAVRRSVRIAIPVNMLLGLACLLVAFEHGQGTLATFWFTASTLVNLGRIHLCRQPLEVETGDGESKKKHPGALTPRVAVHLRRFWLGALVSGLVWAGVPLMCGGYTSSATIFYLTVVCGVTAGAVTHGTAYARVPVAFITPPLLAVVVCLLYHGSFDRYCLAATVVLYLLALTRSAVESESAFRQASRIKNHATSLAGSLEEAHRRALTVQEQMRHQAWHDHLTGLLNRNGFMERAGQHMSASSDPMCLIMLDLDGFKIVNDIYGHRHGDEVLVEVGRRLREQQPAGALVARLGGDEFAILCPHETVAESVESLAQRLILTVPRTIKNAERLGISIGIHIAATTDLTDMLRCADEALYEAKTLGRNHFRVFDESLRARLNIRRAIERDLPQALAMRTLDIYFQPIFRDGGTRLDSVEALLRWRHPEHGPIAPQDIAFIADTSGQSELLMEYVLRRACELMTRFRQMGLAHVRVAINLFPRKIAQIPVDRITLDMLDAMDLPSSMLEVEVTEEATTDIEIVQWRLGQLSAAGVRIAVDDFGVGFSSLSSLRHPYVNKVKIDRSLVSGLCDHGDNRLLVEAIVKLGQLLATEVVAEGVEHESEWHMLRALGCDLMQGFHLAMPMPVDELMDWIAHVPQEVIRPRNPSGGG